MISKILVRQCLNELLALLPPAQGIFHGFAIGIFEFEAGGEAAAEDAHGEAVFGHQRPQNALYIVLGVFALRCEVEGQNHLLEAFRAFRYGRAALSRATLYWTVIVEIIGVEGVVFRLVGHLFHKGGELAGAHALFGIFL